MRYCAARLLLVALLLLSGCVSLTAQGERVRVVPNRQGVAECPSLGSLLSTSGWGGLAQGLGYDNNERDLQNETAKRGGNTLVILSESGWWSPTTLGEAYRCQQVPSQMPTAQPRTTPGHATKETDCRRLWPDNLQQFEICMRQ